MSIRDQAHYRTDLEQYDMESQQQEQVSKPPPHPHTHARPHYGHLPSLPSQIQHTTQSTPASLASSPGPFSPPNTRPKMYSPSMSENASPAPPMHSPLLHPLQHHRVRETHKALVDTDYITGRKIINHYEIIDELGRGVHGKVKLARNLETGENVAIKIIPRFSKKRRLGKVTAMSTQDKSKREIAILKKIRHPNVVALLEVIDDPELKKIYMVLEHVELGEIVWRKKGLPLICANERRRVEREMRGEEPTPEETVYERSLERRQAVKDAKRERISQNQSSQAQFWSLEYGADEEEFDYTYGSLGSMSQMSQPPALRSKTSSMAGSRATSRAPSRTHSYRSLSRAATSRAGTPQPSEPDSLASRNEDESQTPSAVRNNPVSSLGLDAPPTMPWGYEEGSFRGRSPSMADSIISHMSSIDYNRLPDLYADDFSYVPCFTIETARSTFRDTVLGLEYLHYEGVVHRDIKPANLLWTRDHRVKISDFGVSYFGRPIRDGEPDETVSESEARDFDNDLELAKTVGTPAFFAPELCYTDNLDALPGQSQPKITEQIDVWSLGVTLYCLIYARIPFLAEDEWQMFRKIATEEVYIPTRRLRPVDPTTKPSERSLHTRYNRPPYRSDHELIYEDIEPELVDLLRRMLTKHPDKRIRLRDVKRHPWVVKGIPNVIAWLDDTDPSRRTSGKKIQVDQKEMEHAVVPLTLLERARSAVKKAVEKVMHPRGDRADNASRRRATSSAASSGGESPVTNPSTPFPLFPREHRRRSIRADRRAEDYFASLQGQSLPSEHPLTHSVAVSPDYQAAADNDGAMDLHTQLASAARSSLVSADQKALPPLPRHNHTRSTSNALPPFVPGLYESRTMPPTPCSDGPPGSLEDLNTTLRKARDVRQAVVDYAARSKSVDRGLFASNDKRAEAKVSLSTAVAPGALHLPLRPHMLRSAEGSQMSSIPQMSSSSPLSSELRIATDSNRFIELTAASPGAVGDERQLGSRSGSSHERPTTAQRLSDLPDAQTPPPRVYNSSTPESFAKAQETMNRRHIRDFAHQQLKRRSTESGTDMISPAMIPCPPSPDDERPDWTRPRPPAVPTRNDTAVTIITATSSTSTSMGNLTTPLTSPSEAASPVTIANPIPDRSHNTEQILAFQSDPSLPALLSSTSSMSGDAEGDFLGNPGAVVTTRSVLETTDSLTPPALAKGPMTGFPLETPEHEFEDGTFAVGLGDPVVAPRAAPATPLRAPARLRSTSRAHAAQHSDDNNDDDDSDSDEGLVMAKSKNHKNSTKDLTLGRNTIVRRRGTNGSVRSTDTAKKMVVQTDSSAETPSCQND